MISFCSAFLWLYIYIFAAMPWKIISPNRQLFHSHDLVGYLIENLVVAAGFGVLFLRTRGSWRTVYGHLFGAIALYVSGLFLEDIPAFRQFRYAGTLLRLPMLSAFVWLGTTGSSRTA